MLEDKLLKRHELSQFILEYLYDKSEEIIKLDGALKDEVMVEFSVFELKDEFNLRLTMFNFESSVKDIENALFYLSKIGALNIEGGFLVLYNPMEIRRIELDNKKRYKVEDYQKLKEFYENKMKQIHIVGEYARKMASDYEVALKFVDDYFQLNYSTFLNKYFGRSRQNEIKRSITPAKFKQLFGELSPAQLSIITDNKTKNIVVAAGPGSGKTRVLVHKLASLLLMEDVKHDQLLMLTFSRAAATEFKKRLLKLVGNAANFIEIKTFHSYCFDLLGRVGTIEKSDEIIKEAVGKIRNSEVEIGRITKTVLVIDEAQDMNADEFELVSTLMEKNEDMRVIAVGDDDQNIYEFRGASSKYLENMIKDQNAVKYELVENYRSYKNLVDFTNNFVKKISRRLKSKPIYAMQGDNGKIKLVCYKGMNLITPLVKDILTEDLCGTTCILTRTNDEALKIAGLLIKKGLKARLIQSNEGFNLLDLLEVRFFLSQLNFSEAEYIIDNELWENAKRKLKDKFQNSLNYEICLNIIRDFEITNSKSKYKSDFESFIRESKLEDFYGEKVDTIFVSTIHKAKGREFDNVYLILNQFELQSDQAKRLLYVAMTRAKQNLTIHYNGSCFNSSNLENVENVEMIRDDNIYLPPKELGMQLGFKDVWLDFFLSTQSLIAQLNSGDELIALENCCLNSKGQVVLKFSKQFMSKIENIKQKNYVLKKAKIRFIVYWQKEDSEYEIRIILPEVYFEKLE